VGSTLQVIQLQLYKKVGYIILSPQSGTGGPADKKIRERERKLVCSLCFSVLKLSYWTSEACFGRDFGELVLWVCRIRTILLRVVFPKNTEHNLDIQHEQGPLWIWSDIIPTASTQHIRI
jgi:hypothetical protein